jgi:hypothetical protein
MGLVRYRGVIYPGKHPRLVEPETWQQVQDLLSAKYQVESRNEQRPQGILAGADSPTTPVEVVGWSQNNMVEPTRLNANRFAAVSGGRLAL